jgi:hypothetical protein
MEKAFMPAQVAKRLSEVFLALSKQMHRLAILGPKR